jgi:hypothetical protein
MKVQIVDEAALASPLPRNVRLYLRLHGWTRAPGRQGEPDIWILPADTGNYEVIAPSSHLTLDYARRIAELLRTLSIVESRSELEILRDLVTLTFDIQQIHSEHGGPPGTAPLRDAADAFAAAHSMLAAAWTSFEEPRLVLPTRRPPRAADLMRRVLTGPATEGSYVISIWVPVPSRLRPDEDGVLFEPEELLQEEPYERSATRFLNRALEATHTAAQQALDGDIGIEAFTQRENQGVSANLCESLVNLAGQDGTTFDVHFSWALERPVSELSSVVRFSTETIPVLREAARTLRFWIPEENVRITGNVVRLHRESNYGAGEVSIAGVVSSDTVGQIRRVSVSLAEEDYQKAIAAHETYTEVEVVGSLTQRGNRTYLNNPTDFQVRPVSAE